MAVEIVAERVRYPHSLGWWLIRRSQYKPHHSVSHTSVRVFPVVGIGKVSVRMD